MCFREVYSVCTPADGHDHAGVMAGLRACRSSNWSGLGQPRAGEQASFGAGLGEAGRAGGDPSKLLHTPSGGHPPPSAHAGGSLPAGCRTGSRDGSSGRRSRAPSAGHGADRTRIATRGPNGTRTPAADSAARSPIAGLRRRGARRSGRRCHGRHVRSVPGLSGRNGPVGGFVVQPVRRRLRPGPKRRDVDRREPPITIHETPVDHHALDGGRVLGMDDPVGDIVEGT